MPLIKPEIAEKIKEASDLMEVISNYVDLKKSGTIYKGLSPFIKEKTPSFTVSPGKGIWKDFSSGKGGNHPVSFLMAIENISYPEAIESLAKRYSIKVEYDNTNYTQEYYRKEERQQELRPVLESVIRKYEIEFRNLPKDHPAKVEIYQKRNYNEETVRKYRIGYAPGGNFIYNLCVQTGRKQDAIDLGLINENNDRWFGRVIFPLMDRQGTHIVPVGLAGRRLNEEKKYPKWLNSSESELYKKDTFWYGMDQGRDAILKQNEVWLVEGYNDVIAWQENGISNTLASCGTAISRIQMKILKKLCDRVIFCFDPDDAGKKAMLKLIPEFIRYGFRVQTVFLCPDLDPDDFVRFWAPSIAKHSLVELGNDSEFRDDGFKFLMQENFKGKDEVDKAKETKSLAEVIAEIEDDAMRGIYTNWLSQESGIKLPQVKNYMKTNVDKKSKSPIHENGELYLLPTGLTESLEQLRPLIEKYQMFMALNQVWIIEDEKKPPYSFKSVSNFTIEILTHMHDEKYPMKLLRIKNVHGVERVFDVQSSEINTPMSFENTITAHGNFRWQGNRREQELLKTYLFDRMGTGRKIDVLGWQEGDDFWVWNNKILDPEGPSIIPDENGVFIHNETSYYIPSANSIYKTNKYKYEAQKKVISRETTVTFQNYTSQMLKVHKNHGMTGILFAMASMFQDIIVSEEGYFPLFFLIGPASSGKDQLVYVCQSLFGRPQTAINLEGQVSTIKAQVREFAQFGNLISHLSEYKNGDPRLDGMLKGLWDRVGYKRGNLESHVGVDGIPILSSVMMTGNHAPDDEALITRAIWNFMDQTVFSQKETEEFEKLRDMTKKGISSLTDDILKHRRHVKELFKPTFREFKITLGQRKPEANSRMVANLSVLGTFFQLFANTLQFPFTHQQMMAHFELIIDKQMTKLNSANINNRWWDCFLASMRGSFADQISIGRDFKLSGHELYFNFTSCYNRISRQWYTQYKENPPAKGLMMESLKKEGSWIGDTKATRMASGKASRSTSAYIVNIHKIPIQDEMKFAIDFQLKERGININSQSELGSSDNLPI